jgi:hypothetical protein
MSNLIHTTLGSLDKIIIYVILVRYSRLDDTFLDERMFFLIHVIVLAKIKIENINNSIAIKKIIVAS